MNRLLLIIAAAFAGAALVFLGVSAFLFFQARTEAAEAATRWEASQKDRQAYVDRKTRLAQTVRGALPATTPNVRAIVEELLPEAGIEREKMTGPNPISSAPKGQVWYDVTIRNVTLSDMAGLLGALAREHPYLRVRELHATAESGQSQEYRWRFQVAGPALD